MLGTQTPSIVQVPGAAHAACVVTVHVPAGAQQAPVGGGQGFGWQMPNTVQALGGAQTAWSVTVHVPSAAQHAPVGCGQGLGTHKTPRPCHEPGAAQPASGVIVQVPARAQHAPVGTQGFGSHVPNTVHVLGDRHAAPSVTVQAPR